ncbi:MAG: ThuA domain-containing protein [Sphingobacteriales bacterium]|nr:MAG: ThuA domain-containing protein [Sphingobacteriales bacterium]
MKKIITSVIVLFFVVSSVNAQKQFKALLVTTTRGWHHESLHYGVVALNKLATQNNFDLVLMQDPNSINDKYLADFQVVIFLCTTGDIFDSAQQKVFERYIQSGKGYVGVHSASDTEYDWEWYNKLVGRMFHIHPSIQTARLQVLNSSFPGMTSFTNNQLWTEEWYEFGPEKISGLNYLMAVDEKSYNPVTNWGVKKGNGMGALHPISWYHEFDGGRSFYTALGHMPTDFENASFLNHLYGGIYWAATGKK